MKSFGERIKKLREERGWSQEDLDQKIAAKNGLTAEIEEGGYDFPKHAGVLLRFANVFKMPVWNIVKDVISDFEGSGLFSGYYSSIYGTRGFLSSLYCFCNDELNFFPRYEGGYENRFCFKCGKKLKGDCEKCGTPVEIKHVLWGKYCISCGHPNENFIEKYEDAFRRHYELEDEEMLPEYANAFPHRYFTWPDTIKDDVLRNDFQYEMQICLNCYSSGDEVSEYELGPPFDITGEVKYCVRCGGKMIGQCPNCHRPLKNNFLYKLKFCSGCGFKFVTEKKGNNQSISDKKIVWVRVSEDSKDLKILNPECFDQKNYSNLVRHFFNGARLNSRLQQALMQFERTPEQAIFKGDGDTRSGYLGLNRWCFTQSRRDQKGVEPARKVWSFLFREDEPTRLAELSDGKTGAIEVSEEVWEPWYRKISQVEET